MVRTVCPHLLVVVALFCPTLAAQAWSQSLPAPAPPALSSPSQVISSNAFGLVIDLVNGEYERRVDRAVTVGVGASRGHASAETGRAYLNGDVFVRYYPGGGCSSVDRSASRPG